jgi:hypothetical protein
MSMTIGGFTLDDNTYAPTANISNEYFRTESGEIIGGHVIATITGTVSVADEGQALTGSIVMKNLKNIRDLGKKTQCVAVSIPNFKPYGGKAKITSVSIDQGPDPTWVNQGAYTIEVRGLMETIPPNSFGILAEDGVKELSRQESIEIGEDSHGYIYDSGSGASKAFVKFANSLSLNCEPYCSNVDPISVLRKIIKTGPTKAIFNTYNSWQKYLQSRSLSISTDGAISFSCDMILTPPGSNAGALVDLDFGYNKVYDSKDITYTTSGRVIGLASVSWGDIATMSDTCGASKFANAQGVYASIHGKYSNLNNWAGQTLELEEKPNCPKEDDENVGRCEGAEEEENDEDSDYIKPSTSSVAASRTSGEISFNFEWSTTKGENGETCTKNGIQKEITVDITEPQENYVEHILPGYGTLIQNIKCKSAKRISITVATTDPASSCSGKKIECENDDGFKVVEEEYLGGDRWLKIGHSKTKTSNSLTEKRDYIKCRT